mgnify:CR=1 FL=1
MPRAYDSTMGADDQQVPRGRKTAIARAAQAAAEAVGDVASQAGAAATHAGSAAVRLVEERGRRVARRRRPEPLPNLFTKPGEYTITLRTFAQRDGAGDPTSLTLLQNLARVRVVVH